MRKPISAFAALAFVFVSGASSSHAFELIEGSVIEFTSPDDLLLDPANAVIAIDVYGDADRDVNGVTFYSDRVGLGANATFEGTVTVGAVTVIIPDINEIDGWATAPAFTGADQASADNLAQVMSDIRWQGAPNPVTIDIEGLTPGTLYNVQLLTNEGADRNRRWDIGVDGVLVVDDYSSEGGDGVWTFENSFAYSGNFDPGADGILNIVMQQDIGGEPFVVTDNNPILQGVIVHLVPPDILLSNSTFLSDVPAGTTIGTLSSVPDSDGSFTYSLIAGDGDVDNTGFQIAGNELQTSAGFVDEGARSYSVRVLSAEAGGETIEKSFALTALAGAADSDGDGLTDADELALGTDPNDPDTDRDGLNDGEELDGSANPFTGTFTSTDPNPTLPDPPGDPTDPLDPDSDGDGLLDGDEATGALGSPSNPALADTDGDGVSDRNDRCMYDPDPACGSLTNVLIGEVFEFTGPDELNLDPDTVVIAVDVYGDIDRDVNGVTFVADGRNAGQGVATNGAVTVTTTAPNQIPNWAVPPTFTGADPASAGELAQVMASIRWNAAPNPVTVEIDGLVPNALYEIQLLTNEGRGPRIRSWDIEVNGELAVDNHTSAGLEGVHVWTTGNSVAYRSVFPASDEGTITIINQEQVGGDAPIGGTDHNPILGAVIVHLSCTAPTDILGPGFVLTDIALGADVGTLSTVDSNPGESHSYELVAGDGDTDNASFQISGDQLQANADLSGRDGETLSIRIRSTDDCSTPQSFEKILQITVTSDSDADGLFDTWELSYAADLTVLSGLNDADFDADGRTDLQEFGDGTDPTDEDSDDDGVNDGAEAAAGTNPLNPDSDGDGRTDGQEIADGTDPLNPDSDGDGLTDGEEAAAGTDPLNPDSDGDGTPDGADPEPLKPAVACGAFTIIHSGEVIEFTSPDDLHFDPDSAVIAVDVFGATDKDVNGVTFIADGQNAGSGIATNGTVSVTTSAANQIPDWAVAPTFTGADATSAANLADVMRSIRWMGAPGPVTIDIEGLSSGTLYEIQILTNEGRGPRTRSWDIAAEGKLLIDNHTSAGCEGPPENHLWTTGNSISYVFEIKGPEDGTLNIVMQEQLGGNPPIAGTDHNPILQGIVIHEAKPPVPISLDVEADGANLILSWNSKAGKVYDILSTTDPSLDPATWPVFGGLENIAATPPRNIETFARPGDPERFFVVSEKEAPPFYTEDFETDTGWTTGVNDGNGNTMWERGTPSGVGPVSGANGSANCFGTNLSSDYSFDADIWLRSPAIDLTDPAITGARMRYQEFKDIEEGFDAGSIRVLRASDDLPLGPDLANPVDGSSGDWATRTLNLPPEAIGEVIKIEFQFTSDDIQNFPGWYIDDVELSLR